MSGGAAGKTYTYVLVPKVERLLYRVEGSWPNRRRLLEAMRRGELAKSRVRFNPPRTEWSKARVREAKLSA